MFFWISIIIVFLIIISSKNTKKGNSLNENSNRSNNSVRNSYSTNLEKTMTPSITSPLITNVQIKPTLTPLATPVYIIYNSKDINGAPFYSRPNKAPDLLIRSLGNETKIEILGEKEFHNDFDWYPIRDDQGRKGWVQSFYVTDIGHNAIKPTYKNNFHSTQTPSPQRKPSPTPFKIIWTCYDVTTYDYNWNNDNKCVSNTNEVVYVSDARARQLDPYYHPY